MLFLNAHRILCRPLIQYKILASFYRKLHASNSTENLLSGLVCHKKSMPKKYKEYEISYPPRQWHAAITGSLQWTDKKHRWAAITPAQVDLVSQTANEV